MPSALLILSEGAEEMETVISADVMRRGQIDVTIAGLVGTDPVLCSRNVVIKPDVALSDVAGKDFDIIVLPGGAKGAQNLAESSVVGEILKKQASGDRWVASVCAAPIALKSHGIHSGKKLTSHPGVKDQLSGSYQYQEDRVVVDGKLITSRGPGTCFEFALAIVTALQGKDKSDALVPPMLVKL
jgi:protein DJ-1